MSNLSIYETGLDLFKCDPQVMKTWLEMYGTKVDLLKPKDSKVMKYYQTSFGSVNLEDTAENYEISPVYILINNLAMAKTENEWEDTVLLYYPEKLLETYLIKLTFLDNTFTFRIIPNSIETYDKLVYRCQLKLIQRVESI